MGREILVARCAFDGFARFDIVAVTHGVADGAVGFAAVRYACFCFDAAYRIVRAFLSIAEFEAFVRIEVAAMIDKRIVAKHVPFAAFIHAAVDALAGVVVTMLVFAAAFRRTPDCTLAFGIFDAGLYEAAVTSFFAFGTCIRTAFDTLVCIRVAKHIIATRCSFAPRCASRDFVQFTYRYERTLAAAAVDFTIVGAGFVGIGLLGSIDAGFFGSIAFLAVLTLRCLPDHASRIIFFAASIAVAGAFPVVCLTAVCTRRFPGIIGCGNGDGIIVGT